MHVYVSERQRDFLLINRLYEEKLYNQCIFVAFFGTETGFHFRFIA